MQKLSKKMKTQNEDAEYFKNMQKICSFCIKYATNKQQICKNKDPICKIWKNMQKKVYLGSIFCIMS